MPFRSVTLRIGGDASGARRAGAEATAIGDKIDNAHPTLHIGADIPKGALAALQAQLAALTTQARNINVGLDVSGMAKLAALNQQIVAITKSLEGRSIIGDKAFARTQAQLAGVAAGLTAIGKMHEEPTISVKVDKALSSLALGSLFTGGLFSLTALHFIIDAFIELASVVVPATLAVAAFGIAAAATFGDIKDHLTVINTVATATGTVIKPMSQAFANLQDAVRPQVMQLFGDALKIVNSQTGTLATLAKNAGSQIDVWAAKFTADITSGKGVIGTFAHVAGRDLALLGGILGTLAGAFGNLLKAAELSHVAQALFGIIGVGAKLLDLFTRLPTPILATVLAIHGIWLWGRLALAALASFGTWMLGPWRALGGVVLGAGTRFAFFGQKALDVAATLGVAQPALEKAHTNIEKLGTSAEGGAAKTGLLVGSLNVLKAIPVWGWVALGVVALGTLIFALSRVRTATQNWLDSMQAALARTPVTDSINKLFGDINRVSSALVSARTAAAGVVDKFVAAGRSGNLMSSGLEAARLRVTQLSAGQQILGDQAKLLTFRLGTLAGKFGLSLPQAMAVAQLAGIKTNDLIHIQAASMNQLEIQVGSLIAGYRAMGQTAGEIGADINAVTFASSDQLAAMKQLNSAWDTFTQTMSGPVTGFIGFAQSVVQFANDAKTAGSAMHGFGGAVQSVAHHVTTASLQLQSDFQSTFTSATQLFDAMRLAGAGGHAMEQGIKAAIAVMLPMTRGNKEAVAQLSVLAQEVHGPATDSFKVLHDWVGKMHNPMKILQGDTAGVSLKMLNLAKDAANLSTVIQQDLNKMIANTILNTTKVQSAMTTYTHDLQNNTATTAQGKKDRQNLIDQIFKATGNMSLAKQEAKLLTIGVLGLHGAMKLIKSFSATISLVGAGKFSITGPTGFRAQGPGGHGGPFKAAGGLITGGTPGRDSVLISAMPGEVVVPTHMVNAGAVDHLRGYLPGFAKGGLVGNPSASIDALSKSVTSWSDQFASQFFSAMESAMRSAMQAAMAAAARQAAASGFGIAPKGPLQSYARKLLAAYGWSNQWGAFNDIVMRESGWNVHATNPSSGAYGIPQALPPGKMASAGADWRTSGFTQLRWMMAYIKSRWHDPNGADANERAHSWYDNGGLLMPGLTLAHNNTGFPELVTPLSGGGGGGSWGGGGDVYNIYVQGDTDPDGAALRIVQKLRKYKMRHGNAALGIS